MRLLFKKMHLSIKQYAIQLQNSKFDSLLADEQVVAENKRQANWHYSTAMLRAHIETTWKIRTYKTQCIELSEPLSRC